MACTNCGNDWCTGCTSKFAHVAGDPYDPADEYWKKEKPRTPPPEESGPGPNYDGSLPHCAGDPYDPADEEWKSEKPRTAWWEPSPPPPPKPPPTMWDQPCPTCNGAVEITGYWTQQGMITSEFPLTDMMSLKCTACGHAWDVEE